MSYGDFPRDANDHLASLLLPRGAIIDGKLDEVQTSTSRTQRRSRSSCTTAGTSMPTKPRGCTRSMACTEPNFALGPKTKGTRNQARGVRREREVLVGEVAPLEGPRDGGRTARPHWSIAYMSGRHRREGAGRQHAQELDVPITALFSTLGRTAARGLECLWRRTSCAAYDKLIAESRPATRPRPTPRSGTRRPGRRPPGRRVLRGAARCARSLDHDREHQDRQLPVRRADDMEREPARRRRQHRSVRSRALDTPLADPDKPLEILRTLHSFDPCLACATHVIAPDGTERTRITVR